MPQPWPWVKVMKRSSSTFPQTHIFFVPNIKGLAQTVLMWEGKVFAAADADADADADEAETDWKHKVTPERGDFNMLNWSQWNFAHVTTVTLSRRVQNFVVIGWGHFKPEHCKFWSNFEFDRNIVSGTGAWDSIDPDPCWHMASLGHNEFTIQTNTSKVKVWIHSCFLLWQLYMAISNDIFIHMSSVVLQGLLLWSKLFSDICVNN